MCRIKDNKYIMCSNKKRAKNIFISFLLKNMFYLFILKITSTKMISILLTEKQ